MQIIEVGVGTAFSFNHLLTEGKRKKDRNKNKVAWKDYKWLLHLLTYLCR